MTASLSPKSERAVLLPAGHPNVCPGGPQCPASKRQHEDSEDNRTRYCVYGGVAIFLSAVLFFIAHNNVTQNGGVQNYGFVISGVMSVVLVFVTTALLILFNPQVYGFLFCLAPNQIPMQAPYWYWAFITGFMPYLSLWTALFFLGDHWLGKTGENSRIDAHMIWAIVGLNTAIGVSFGFLFGHCGAKKKYQDGKCNFVGMFTPVFVTLIWIFLFATQGMLFYIFSTHVDQTLRSLGQWLYWAVVLCVYSYLLCGVFCLPTTEAGQAMLQQVSNIIATLQVALLTWQTMLFGVVMADADNHSHLSRTYIYIAAGMQSMAYSFVLMSVILLVAKQAVNAGLKVVATHVDGAWMTGPIPRELPSN